MSAGPPAQVTIEGFRLRIFSSTRTPHLVQRLRQALVSTLLFGEWLRCDDAAVQVTFGKDFVGRSENFDGPGADALGAPIGDSQARADADDDLTVTSTAANLHVHDRKGRIYAFRAVGACLRRTWGAFDGARGAYEMEAEGAQWRRFPPAVLGAAGLKTRNPWRYLATLPFSLPGHVYTLCTDPLRLVDLSVPHAQIQFDDFRMRDAELVKQGFDALVKTCMGVPVIPGS